MSFTLGSYVSTRRKALGLVQQKIADRLNYTVQSISAFESGESQLSLSSMPELANILELSLDDLFLETPNAPRVPNANQPFDEAQFAKKPHRSPQTEVLIPRTGRRAFKDLASLHHELRKRKHASFFGNHSRDSQGL